MRIKVGKNLVASFSYKEDKEEVLRELNVIAAREGKHKSEIIIGLIEEYVKAHGSGNPSFKLENWVEEPTFTAVPTIHARNETWMSYLKDCKISERADTLKKFNTIRKLIIASGPLK
mgnify:CR=1 FL=1